ncbi:polysaccharide deacetylase family protein [Yoonia sp. BS5-3]|uniref:Chitooligosaccharide deacetylase n=1 Tax=Yoonia phaeophyticola TaxID=3137369 RepID=A0ABZ2V2B0_9RHOB
MIPKWLASLTAIFIISISAASAQTREIAVTIDDLPFVRYGGTTSEQGLVQVNAINAALAAHDIRATGFVIGNQINRNTAPILNSFAAAGHRIGNHSWSHPSYDELTRRAFRRETRRTHRALAPWIDTPLLYRFPYLHEGETPQTKQAAEEVLAALGYTNVPVTIDNDEWRFNADYVDALTAGDTDLAQAIAEDYLEHMRERTAHFQALGHQALGRDVKHILLLHLNQINADHLGTLLDWYADNGWVFITVQEALTDPLYSAPDLYAGARGLSQIERVMGQQSD